MREVLMLYFLALVVLLIYSNTLEGPFTFDDSHNIRDNPHIRLSRLTLGSKEIAATLSFFIFLYEWYLFQDLSWTWLKRHLFPMAGIWRRKNVFYPFASCGFLATW